MKHPLSFALNGGPCLYLYFQEKNLYRNFPLRQLGPCGKCSEYLVSVGSSEYCLRLRDVVDVHVFGRVSVVISFKLNIRKWTVAGIKGHPVS